MFNISLRYTPLHFIPFSTILRTILAQVYFRWQPVFYPWPFERRITPFFLLTIASVLSNIFHLHTVYGVIHFPKSKLLFPKWLHLVDIEKKAQVHV